MDKFAYFGTPEFSVSVLEVLEDRGLVPSRIITAPDAPRGRKLVLTPPPVKVWADAHGIPTLQPTTLRSEEAVKTLQRENFDLFIVAAYGKILPQAVLDIPAHGTLNIHPSLLPKYRGMSPIESQILSDDRAVGVSIIKLDQEVDHGPILKAEAVELPNWPLTTSELEDVLWKRGAHLLADVLPDWVSGKLEAKEQDHSQATYTKKISKEDGLVTLKDDPYRIFLKFKAYARWPGTYFFTERAGKPLRVIIRDASFENGELRILKVLPEGGREMRYEDFLRG